MTIPDLRALRGRVDEVDEQIIALLGRRFRLTEEIGRVKSAGRLSSVDPDRETEQAARYSELAAQYEVGAHLVRRVFRVIVDEVVTHHQQLVDRQRTP
jgi:chorismate mutase